MTAAAPTYVVAGNGSSLERLPPGIVCQEDHIVRTNNFFFERRHYLGRRVDLAMMGGDPRVAPFMFETLHKCRSDYDLRQWTAINPRVVRAGMRRFAAQFTPFPWRDGDLKQQVGALCARYARLPMTGTNAMLAAYGLGARNILLTGFDLYAQGVPRYPFPMGPHHRALMEPVINLDGLDSDQHDTELDCAILNLLLVRGDVDITCANEGMVWNTMLPLAPKRDGRPVVAMARLAPPTDWASNVGPYPIRLLRALRWTQLRLRGRVKKSNR